MMDSHQYLQQQSTVPTYQAAPSLSSRPTISFPLGTALLLIIIFCLSGVLSCCYHWDKVQSLRRRALGRSQGEDEGDEENASNGGGGAIDDMPPPPTKASLMDQYANKDQKESWPVIMPGDRIPKFIAWPRPWDLPSSFAPPQLHKLANVDGQPSPTPPAPLAAASCATTCEAGPAPEPAEPVDSVV